MVQHEGEQACAFKDSNYVLLDKGGKPSFFAGVEFIDNESDSVSELKENEDDHECALFILERGSCLPLFLSNLKH